MPYTCKLISPLAPLELKRALKEGRKHKTDRNKFSTHFAHCFGSNIALDFAKTLRVAQIGSLFFSIVGLRRTFVEQNVCGMSVRHLGTGVNIRFREIITTNCLKSLNC